MAMTIHIGTETEGANRWTYEVRIAQDGQTFDYQVSLGWADYDLWSHGRVAPERVVRAAFEFLLAHESASSIMAKFDCAVIRRYFPEVDAELPKMI